MAVLQREEVANYLRDVGILPATQQSQVEQLAGGVSSAVYRVTWDATALVVKQALPKLQVSDEWTSRVERSATEARAARILSGCCPLVPSSRQSTWTSRAVCS